MPRKAVWPPRPHPHKASGRDRVRWNSRTYYLGPIGSAQSRQKYLELIARLEREGAHQEEGERPLTILQLCAAWHLHAQAHYGVGSHEAREYVYALQPVLGLFGDLPAADFGVLQLRKARQAMVDSGRLCKNVINRRVVRVRTVWRWAEEEAGLVPPNSWGGLRALKPIVKPPAGLKVTPKVAPADRRAVATVAAEARRRGLKGLSALVLVELHTGARPGELLTLRAGEVDRKGEVWTAAREEHKNAWRDQERVLYFGPKAQAVLAPLLEGADAGKLLFPNKRGYAYDRRTYHRAVVRLCEALKLGAAAFHPYQLRHAAKRHFTRTSGLDAARTMLGQASISTTDGYAKAADERLAVDAATKAG